MNTFSNPAAHALIDRTTTLFWFRRDLRINDNAGLFHALRENENVLPVFIFDSVILDKLEDKADRRVEFVHQSLDRLKNELEKSGSSLLILFGDPVDIFKQIHPKKVYANHDYEPHTRSRDKMVAAILEGKGSHLLTHKDQVIFEKNEIVKDNQEPYTVFTPYAKRWKETLCDADLKKYTLNKYLVKLKKVSPLQLPSLHELGFERTGTHFPPRLVRSRIIVNYHQQRNFPAFEGTTRLSVHIRFGTISIRELVKIAREKNDTWLNELVWREFYQMILWHFPQVENRAFKPAYERISWRNNEDDFRSWCEGTTGFPIVDAGMRELNSTGFMHNRVRMIVASFLCKHLLIDWRWGEAYFAQKLLDFDLAANNGGWQWAAGSGCDAAPYFRIFNPDLQTEKFDPKMEYIKKWVPEVSLKNYRARIVDHKFARDRALKAYGKALRKN